MTAWTMGEAPASKSAEMPDASVYEAIAKRLEEQAARVRELGSRELGAEEREKALLDVSDAVTAASDELDALAEKANGEAVAALLSRAGLR